MTKAPSEPQSLLAANIICSASMLLWAFGLPAAQSLIPHVPPLPLSAARITLAALFLLPIWWVMDGRAALAGANWLRGILVGGTGFALGAYLLIVGQSMTGPVTVAVISATMPVLGIALEVMLDGRKMTWGLTFGLVLSILGALLVVVGRPGEAEFGLGLGALFCFCSVVAFTLGSRWSVTAFPALSDVGRTTITLTGAAICVIVAAAIQQALGAAQPDWPALGWNSVAALLIYAIGGMALSQVMWIMAVGRLGIGVSAMHLNLTPFYVMIIVFALGGEWSWLQAFSAAMVSLGVLIAQGVIPLRQSKVETPVP